jgi:hypothetical protein
MSHYIVTFGLNILHTAWNTGLEMKEFDINVCCGEELGCAFGNCLRANCLKNEK